MLTNITRVSLSAFTQSLYRPESSSLPPHDQKMTVSVPGGDPKICYDVLYRFVLTTFHQNASVVDMKRKKSCENK